MTRQTYAILSSAALVALALATIGIGGCFSSDSVDCPNGLVCPQGSQCAAAQDVCITNGCGDGIQSGTEACDDGNIIDGDGCSADCSSNETCGNNVIDTTVGETCDDNNTVDGDGCSSTCRNEGCGNGHTDQGEECDDGKQCTDGSDCTGNANACDGIGDSSCETRSADGCSADCQSTEFCGNDYTDYNEVCDDGRNCTDGTPCNAADGGAAACVGIGDGSCEPRSGDGCGADCQSDETCGNGIWDIAAGEACDTGKLCADMATDCTEEGQPACVGIGDGTCRTRDGDGCSLDCTSDETCGNLVVDETVGEICDDGKNCSDGTPCNAEQGGASACLGIGDGSCRPRDGDGCRSDCRSGEGCGNGQVDLDEQCDDGQLITDPANNNDDCLNTCRLNLCGDGWQDLQSPGIEECDGDNAGHGGETPTCDRDCTARSCGDGTVNAAAGEQCDNVGPVDSDTCDADCTVAICGDSYPNSEAGEACDDGGNSATCDADCTAAACGDGYYNPINGEQCDGGDGSPRDTATCDADCTIAYCGDNHENSAAGEACDDGGNSAACNANCTAASCGDGYFNPFTDGQCDDGDGTPKDSATCDYDCTIAFCGDAYENSEAGEACDDGGNSAACNADCTVASCGDGYFNTFTDPECDDGNALNTDNCLDDCTYNTCGDGWIDSAEPRTEFCDGDGAGHGGETATCDVNCTQAECGDGTVNGSTVPPEQCDSGDGTPQDSATCDSDCTIAVCGDGYPNTAAGEVCDTAGNTETCDADCTAPLCGDGLVNPNTVPAEECDVAGHPDTANCDSDCTFPTCGDSHFNSAFGEECDDGNDGNDNNACLDGCIAAVCGDGFLCDDAGTCTSGPAGGVEVCDDGNTDTETTCPYGEPTCTACTADCGTVLDLTGPYCGDGTWDDGAGEICDDGNTEVCGTCSPDCGTYHLAAATGSINVVPEDELTDGWIFILDDGFNAPVVFEFELGGGVESGHVAIDLSAGGITNAKGVRDAVRTAIADQKAAGNLFITENKGGTATVTLTHDIQTALGNQTIITTADPASDFSVTGMSGGYGADCAIGIGCASNDDCASGLCGPGGTCIADCGNGIPETGEDCDDGNSSNNDSCLNDCTLATCGDPYVCTDVATCTSGPGGGVEECDDNNGSNNDSCLNNCAAASCGDPYVCTDAVTCTSGPTGGVEECDDNNSSNNDSCLNNCAAASCGDPYVCTDAVTCTSGPTGGVEECDDNNGSNNDSCLNNCAAASCGDPYVCTDAVTCTSGPTGGVEECDDNNGSNNDSCLNNCAAASCGDGYVCNDGATCVTLLGQDEVCDDNNTDSCGTCSTDCQTATTPAAATGSITVVGGSVLVDGDTFTVSDGYGDVVVFEFDSDASITGDVAVPFTAGSTVENVRDAVVTAINGVTPGLLVTASPNVSTSIVDLTHDRDSDLGNVAITESVTDDGFLISGLSGGAAGDCTTSTQCSVDGDCASNACTSLVCE